MQIRSWEARTQPEIENILSAIQVSKGRFFSVLFVARGTGQLRKMTCKVKDSKELFGANLPYDPRSRNLLPVRDCKINEPRLVSLDSILSMKIQGREYTW